MSKHLPSQLLSRRFVPLEPAHSFTLIPERSPDSGLAPRFAPIARQRLGLLAGFLFFLTLCSSLIPGAFLPQAAPYFSRSLLVLVSLSGVLVDALFLWLTWGSRLSHDAFLRLGYPYLLFRSLTLSFTPLPLQSAPVLTWSSVLLPVVPLFLPTVRRWTVLSLCIAAPLPPLLLALFASLTHSPLTGGELVRSASNALGAGALALLSAELIARHRTATLTAVGNYHLVQRIGRGGMGEVWRAEHRFLARPAAVKLIDRRPQDSARQAEKKLQRFRREAQVTAHLTSPHTIQVFDYGVSDQKSYFYVMEYLDGFDLQQLVRKTGPLPPARALYLLRQICDSVGEAHQAGLIHRDLKPSNLFIVRRGLQCDFVKVLDFGLVGLGDPLRTATFDGKITATGMMTGTPAYISPEMVTGSKVDHRADIYSLGCVLYYLLTGQALFPGLTPMQMALAHAQKSPPAPSALAPHPLPEQLDRFVLWMLAKDPTERPSCIEELLSHFDLLSLSPSWTPADAEAWWDAQKPLVSTSSMRLAVRREASRDP